MYGGIFSVRIPLSQFQSIDIEKLYSTMINKLIDINKNLSDILEENHDSYPIEDNQHNDDSINDNCIGVLIKLLLLSIVIGVTYGISIYIFKVNIIIIPFFGSIAIIYFYSKKISGKKINIFIRITLGLICALQMFIGVITTIFLSNDMDINILVIIKEYFENLIENPLDQGTVILISIFCFWCGAFQGHTFKFEIWIKKLFMKRSGKYFYSKEGRFITIYLKDPVTIEDQKDNKFITEIVQGCLIEKVKKRVKGFCIPINCIDDLGIIINQDDIINIGDYSYYKIDLGGDGNYKAYVFTCSLIMNSEKELEIVNIQI